jgi:3',5'-cyclic AMP phosphodiesterase CpdA
MESKESAKRIIHMSDLHAGFRDLGDRFRAIAEALIRKEAEKARECVVVLTGDLVENAHDDAAYDEVRPALERLKEAGFEHLLVIPGNHDYGTGMHGNRKCVQLFKRAFFEDEGPYPRKDVIGDTAFIGLDSMAEELHWYDELFAQGQIGKKQLRRLDEALRSDDVTSCAKRVIYLHHHPFDWLPLHELKDSRALEEIVRGAINDGISVNAILYGHNHLGRSHNGRWGVPRCYDAGTATLRERGEWLDWLSAFQVHNASRLMALDSEPASDHTLLLP